MRASWARMTRSGLARRELVPSSPLEGWLDRISLAAASGFDLGPEHVSLAWEVASWEPSLEEGERKALCLLVLASLVTQSRGSTRMPARGAEGRSQLATILSGLIAGEAGPDEAAIAAHLGSIEELLGKGRAPVVVGKGDDYRPLILDGPFLYHQKLLRSEKRFAESIAARLQSAPSPVFERDAVRAALDAILARPSVVRGKTVELSGEQQLALLAAAHAPFTVISGGPGTGKTSIVVSILRLLARLGVGPEAIALAAPTGKAAQRLRESIEGALARTPGRGAKDDELLARCPEPSTIHRLLGASRDGRRVRHHEGNPLDARVVVVDEASMIELQLVEALVRAVRPDARLVFLGDARQLPSVGAGAVLRDLVPEEPSTDVPWRDLVRGEIPERIASPHPLSRNAVVLTRSYRADASDPAGAAILRLARAISPGSPGERAAGGVAAALVARTGAGEIVFEGAEAVLAATSASLLRAFLERWYRERIASLEGFDGLVSKAYPTKDGAFTGEATADLERLFRHFESSRVLCLTRERRTGVLAVNAALRAFHVARLHGGGRDDFSPGEPILVLVNDYERSLWNGDHGLALRVADEGRRPRLAAVFRRGEGFVRFPVDLLRGQIERAFATTVHKGQGSELDHVALVLPEKDVPLLTREILYTAVTRARRSVAIVGARELLESGAARVVERFSGAGERIAAALARS